MIPIPFDFSAFLAELNAHLEDPKTVLWMGVKPVLIELLTSIDGIAFDDCYPQRVLVQAGAVQVPFIALGDLKRNKAASGRPKDIDDLLNLP